MSNVADRLRQKIEAEALRLARREDTEMRYPDAAKVSDAMARAVIPDVLHYTNNEPWYQSKVTWGAIIGGATPIIGLIVGTQLTPEEQAAYVQAAVAIGTAVGTVLTLVGRWRARKPIAD